MTEKKFLEYIEAICKRPKMYTPTGSFYEVVSFLEGFGAQVHIENNYYHSVFTPFRKWIAEKFGIEELYFDWKQFQEMYSSESEALKNLPILYKEYAESF
jgi:hypothetical protein